MRPRSYHVALLFIFYLSSRYCADASSAACPTLTLPLAIVLCLPYLVIMGKKGYYAVQSGRSVGVYDTWAECKQAVDGYSGASFKRFDSHDQASAFAGGSGSARGSGYGGQTTSSRSDYGSSDYRSSDYSYGAPRAQAAHAPSRRENIYIDGAAPGNGRDGSRAGYGIYHENRANQHLDRSERLEGDVQTNNRAELTVSTTADAELRRGEAKSLADS